MEYCKHCGARVKEGAVYCAQCGKELYEKEAQSKGQDKKLNKMILNITNFVKTRKRIVGLITVILSLIVFYQVGSSMTSQQHLVSQFEKAINEENTKALSSLLYSPNSEVEINEETAESLLNFFIKNPNQFDEMMGQLSVQANSNNKETDLSSALIAIASDLSPLKITNTGKTGLIFNKYRIEVTPQYMNINTNLEDVKIFVNDKPVDLINNENSTFRLGPYLPGTYEVKAVYEGEYAKSELEEERDLFFYDGEDYPIYLDLNVDFLHIYSNVKDAKILINGSDTGLTVDEADSLGPVSLDGTLKLQLEKDYPWGKVRSEEVQIENRSIKINIEPLNDNFKDMIMEITNQYYINTFTAINTKDVTKLQGMTEQERQSWVSFIEDLEQTNKMLVTDNQISVMYDLQSFSLYNNKDGYYVTLDTGYTLNGDYVSNESTEEQKQKALQNNLEDHFSNELIFDEQENKWLVNKSNELWIGVYFDKKEFELSLD